MFSGLGYTEMLLIGVIALMLFGSRLPDVARNFGRTYRQLRSKVDEFQREFREWERMDSPPTRPSYDKDETERQQPQTPKFTPPPAPMNDDNQKSSGESEQESK